jgi:hypothetical protein
LTIVVVFQGVLFILELQEKLEILRKEKRETRKERLCSNSALGAKEGSNLLRRRKQEMQ